MNKQQIAGRMWWAKCGLILTALGSVAFAVTASGYLAIQYLMPIARFNAQVLAVVGFAGIGSLVVGGIGIVMAALNGAAIYFGRQGDSPNDGR